MQEVSCGESTGQSFCTLLVDSPLGGNAKWLSMSVNVIADDILRVKKDSPDLTLIIRL